MVGLAALAGDRTCCHSTRPGLARRVLCQRAVEILLARSSRHRRKTTLESSETVRMQSSAASLRRGRARLEYRGVRSPGGQGIEQEAPPRSRMRLKAAIRMRVHAKSCSALIIVISAFLGCAAQQPLSCCTSEIAARELAAADGGVQCRIRLLCERCARGDECRAQCFASGVGENVLGGCEHLCTQTFMVRPKGWPKWAAPPGWQECPPAGRE